MHVPSSTAAAFTRRRLRPRGLLWAGSGVVLCWTLLGCGDKARPPMVAPKSPPPAAPAPSASAPLSPWLEHFPGLYVRRGDEIVEAPPQDIAVAKSYARSSVRGPLLDGHRLTILTQRSRYRVGEEVRVIHVHEMLIPGDQLYVMGPKRVRGEYVDDRLVTPVVVGEMREVDPFAPIVYDGPTLASPGVDYAYEVTSFRFS